MSAARRSGRGRTAVLVAMVMASALVASAAGAHQRTHAPAESSVARPAAAAGDSAEMPGALTSPAGEGTGGGAAAPRYPMPAMGKALLEHPHNKVVHFPLAFAVAAALLLVLGRRRPELELAGRWLVWLAAIGGAVAFFTGKLQGEMFEGEPKEWLVDLHQRWGTATAIGLVAWAVLTLWGPTRRYSWAVGLLAATLALVAGFYGGVVAHGE